MSPWLRRVRAGAVVALAFGIAWGTIVTFATTLSFFLVGGLEALVSIRFAWPLLYALWVGIGFCQGLAISVGMSIAGRDRTVDTFPRWLGALLGAGVGSGGWVIVGVLERVGSSVALLQPAAIAMMVMFGAIGAVSTVALLTVARRGALPPAPAEPKKIGS